MLKVTKRPRLIDNPGMANNMFDALSIGPFEAILKRLHPQLLVKGLDVDEAADGIAELARECERRNKKILAARGKQAARRHRRNMQKLEEDDLWHIISKDFSKMDSTITAD